MSELLEELKDKAKKAKNYTTFKEGLSELALVCASVKEAGYKGLREFFRACRR